MTIASGRGAGVPHRPETTTVEDKASRKNLLLLIQLRWIAVVGQVATILFVQYAQGIALPLPAMGGVIAFLVGLNLISLFRYSRGTRITNAELFVELLMDVAALTVQLYLSGGASNPFISLYLLQVILATVLLETWSVWVLFAVANLCFVYLILDYRPLPVSLAHTPDIFGLHIQGMFICFALIAALLVFFVTRITRNLRAQDADFASMRQQSSEEDLIVRMGLLASGAAHELSTPLSTLSVILNDWRRTRWAIEDPEMATELEEMQAEVARCKAIVSGILRSSGEARGENAQRTTMKRFLDAIAAEWQASRQPAAFEYRQSFDPDEQIVADISLQQVIFNLLDNALEASPQWVALEAGRVGDDLSLVVRDRGPGFGVDILGAIGRPYSSTKGKPGSGLGLFLVVNMLRKLGGTVDARNTPQGAAVGFTLPLKAISVGRPGNV